VSSPDEGASLSELRVGPQGREALFRLRTDLVALHGAATTSGARAVLHLPGAEVEVVRDVDVGASELRRRGPVYAQQPTGPLAVPTGRVFLRLARTAGTDLAARLAPLGFKIVPQPHATAAGAWVEPLGGRIEDGLVRLTDLAALPGVEGAEPELLREAHRR
jgi:hypothetical protein